MSSAPTVAVATDADAKRQCPATSMLYTRHRLSTNDWPAAITSNGAQWQHRCPRPMVRDQARNVGSSRMIEPELHHQSGRVSSASWCVHLSSVGQLKTQHHRSSATRIQLRRLRSPESCETLLMPNVSLAQHRPWPNLSLKWNANSVAPRPSSAGPSAHFALAVRPAPLPASA